MRFDRQGIKVKIHCAGAGTVDLDLDAYAEVRRVNGPGGPAHEIAHCTYISDEDYARFCELNVIAEMSPAVWHVPEFQEFHSAPARPPTVYGVSGKAVVCGKAAMRRRRSPLKPGDRRSAMS